MFPIRADSARPEIISFMQRHGFGRMTTALKGPGSVEEGVMFLRSYNIIVHPRCTRIANKLKFYSYKIDPKTANFTPVRCNLNGQTVKSAGSSRP